MSGQVYKVICFIAGIEVPVLSVSSSSQSDTTFGATVTLPWSPFLTKLPKETKVTVFRRNTDIFTDYRLWFCGSVKGITETKSYQGQSVAAIQVCSDGYIWQWRKRNIYSIEQQMSVAKLVADAQGIQESTPAVSGYQNVVGIFANIATHFGGNATKMVAAFLTNIFSLKDGIPNGRCYFDNLSFISDKKVGGAKKLAANDTLLGPGVAYNDLSNFLTTYYRDYKLAQRVVYIDLPPFYLKWFGDLDTFNKLSNSMQSIQGVVTYWGLASYYNSMYGGEIVNIPDATMVVPKDIRTYDGVRQIPKKIPYGKGEFNALAEFLIMPRTVFGRIPLCNIIFPDQVLSKAFQVNHGVEATRTVMIGDMIPKTAPTPFDGLKTWAYHAPVGLGGYFSSLNLAAKAKDQKLDSAMSPYESNYGINPQEASVTPLISRGLYLAAAGEKGSPKLLEATMNNDFLISYCRKFDMQISVTPDVEIVPGSSVLILSEDGEHMIAYCSGVNYSWNIEGQAGSQITLVYPHHYSWDMSNIGTVGNPLADDPQWADDGDDPASTKTTGTSQYEKQYEAFIGCKFSQYSPRVLARKMFTLWKDTYSGDSRRIKHDYLNTGVLRDVCTLQEYVEFYGDYDEVKSVDFDDDAHYHTLGETLMTYYDSFETEASLSTNQYWYYDPYLPAEQGGTANNPIPAKAIKPDYNTIGVPGEIIPSTYISGIVDCHLKYLARVGNVVSV